MNEQDTAKFAKALRRSQKISLLMSGPRAKNLWERARACAELDGEFWECGVYYGGSANLIASAAHPTLFRLFDTFTGFPNRFSKHDRLGCDYHGWPMCPGLLNSDVDAVKANLARYRGLHFHPGIVPASLKPFTGSRIAFAHLDMDLYKSTLAALNFVWPRMVEGGVLVVDDYGSEWTGVSVAVQEKFGILDARIFDQGQCTIIKADRSNVVRQEACAVA